jgi:predicted nucleic acid-binding protein
VTRCHSYRLIESEVNNRGRILPFDGDASTRYAEIDAGRRSSGRPISQFDAMIAAIVRLHGAILVTRNTSDFEEQCRIQAFRNDSGTVMPLRVTLLLSEP